MLLCTILGIKKLIYSKRLSTPHQGGTEDAFSIGVRHKSNNRGRVAARQ
jgi:hypothetical protein